MDRQDVEYIKRDDDDEEFDEFGRKKKKKNKDQDVYVYIFNILVCFNNYLRTNQS